jgi:hypothetical protein
MVGMSRPERVTVALMVAALVAALVGMLGVAAGRPGDAPGDLGRAGAREPGPLEELAAKRDRRIARVAAHFAEQAAVAAAGGAGQQAPTVSSPARGWVGEQPIDTRYDDWEPAIAADPNGPYVYAIVTRYAPKPCTGNCPSPWIAIERSSDGGATWTPGAPLCACKGSGQFDPIIEVVPDTGHVYAVYMNGFNVVFVKSADHGASWSTPVRTWGTVSWNDKPVLAMSDDGRDVYVAWNGPTGGDPWLAQSHDSGATWTQTKIVDSDRYYFAFDADVSADGTIYVSQGSLRYGGKGRSGGVVGDVLQHVFISRDRGATWRDLVVDAVATGEACVAAGCSADFYLGHSAITADADGDLVLAYDGATATAGRQSIFVRRSTDGGRTWTARTAISTAGEMATAPMIESRGQGDVRVAWYETVGGDHDAWNVRYRRSRDGGATWSTAIRLSDAADGAGYKTAAGFAEVYGDYGEMAITSAGKTIAIWGEGYSWIGPGGAWFNRES